MIPLVKFLLIGLLHANGQTSAAKENTRVSGWIKAALTCLSVCLSFTAILLFLLFSLSLSPPITMSVSALMSPVLPCSG